MPCPSSAGKTLTSRTGYGGRPAAGWRAVACAANSTDRSRKRSGRVGPRRRSWPSDNDLTGLDSELAAAVREIRDRIDPVNRILADLPFADDTHRLRIDRQESHSAVRARFRKELRDVRAVIDKAATDADRERAYH